jgi:hypothetical protein
MLSGTRLIAVLVVCLSMGSTARAIIINAVYDATQPGAQIFAADPLGAQLTSIMGYVTSFYEDSFLDVDHTLNITFFYADLADGLLGQHTYLGADANGRENSARVRIDTQNAAGVARNYYYDPTPWDNSEFNMGQVLWRDLTATQQTNWYNANGATVPATFEAGFTGPAITPAAASGFDMLSLVFHEVGHALGMSAANPMTQAEVADGDYDFNSSWIFGGTLAARNPNQPTDFMGHLANPNALMFPSLGGAGQRVLPSHTDLFSMGAGHQYTLLNVPRREFYNPNGNWSTAANWSGARVPTNQDVFVRDGNVATLTGFSTAGSLLVDEGGMVSTGGNTLWVQGTTTLARTGGAGTTRFLVGGGGWLLSNVTNVDSNARLEVFGTVDTGRLNILAGGELRGNGTVNITGQFGELSNDGIIRATGGGTLVINSPNNLALDLSGVGGNGQVIATAADIHFQTGFFKGFTGNMTVGASRQITFDSSFSIGAGGLLLLNGSAPNAATVNGAGLVFVGPNGVLRADGLGVLDNILFMQSSSFVETANAGSELRLNNTTFMDGGRILGPGTVRQNGNVIVQQNTQVDVARYDMDGMAGNTTFTIEANRILTINSPQIAMSPINDFTGTIHLDGGRLNIAPGWRLDGTMNFNQVGGVTPMLAGAGGFTLSSMGKIQVLGSGRIDASAAIEGPVYVGDAFTTTQLSFHGQVFTFPTAAFDVDGPGSFVRFHGPTTLGGGSYVGIGGIGFEGTVNVLADTSIGTAVTDLDGQNGNAQITIQPGILFSINSNTIEPTANDGFDGAITNQGTFSVLAGWRLDGTLAMQQVGRVVPVLDGFGPFRIHPTGTMSTAGDAIVNPPTQVAGTMLINGGVTRVNNTISFEPTASVTIGEGAKLELNGDTTFAGGGYTGEGLLQFNADTTVESNTTINVARVDLDGAAEDAHISLLGSALVLNVDRIDENNNFFAGMIDVEGASARLEVNLSQAGAAWRLDSGGNLTFTTAAALPATMLAGNDLVVNGRIDADGRVRLGANLGLAGRLQLANVGTNVRFGGGGLNLIYNTAILDGPGQITIEDGTRMHLQHGSNVGVNVQNDGLLEVGFSPGEVSIDLDVPGSATIRGFFTQTNTGTFAVELAGAMPGTEHDFLEVTGPARFDGTLHVELIDGFLSLPGEVFEIMTYASRVGQFSDVISVTGYAGLWFEPFYGAQALRIGATALAGDANLDGEVNIADLGILAANWQQGNMNWLAADFNGDGVVDVADLGILAANWQQSVGGMRLDDALSLFDVFEGVAVPDPGAGLLVVVGMAAMLGRRRAAARAA